MRNKDRFLLITVLQLLIMKIRIQKRLNDPSLGPAQERMLTGPIERQNLPARPSRLPATLCRAQCLLFSNATGCSHVVHKSGGTV